MARVVEVRRRRGAARSSAMPSSVSATVLRLLVDDVVALPPLDLGELALEMVARASASG